jgi:hypothetical protein
MSQADVLELQTLVGEVRFDDALLEYLLQIVDLTRKSEARAWHQPACTLRPLVRAQACIDEGRDYLYRRHIKRPRSAVFCSPGDRQFASRRHSSSNPEAEQILQDILQKKVSADLVFEPRH